MAETRWFRGEGGGLHQFDVPLKEPYAEQARKGRLVEVPAPASAAAGAPAATPTPAVDPAPADEAADEIDRPGRAHPKADWVAYAADVSGLPAEQLEQLTKAELITEYGG